MVGLLRKGHSERDQDHDHERKEQPPIQDVVSFDRRRAAFEVSQDDDPKRAQSVRGDGNGYR
jgi:hypothetical protein